MFITSKNKYLLNNMRIFGTCSIPLKKMVCGEVWPSGAQITDPLFVFNYINDTMPVLHPLPVKAISHIKWLVLGLQQMGNSCSGKYLILIGL